jgi:hypothetical protein
MPTSPQESRAPESRFGARLTDVKREGLLKPQTVTFGSFAEEWRRTYPSLKELKRSTRESYKNILNNHLIPALGNLRLDKLTHTHVEHYIARKHEEGLQSRTVNRQPAQPRAQVGTQAAASANQSGVAGRSTTRGASSLDNLEPDRDCGRGQGIPGIDWGSRGGGASVEATGPRHFPDRHRGRIAAGGNPGPPLARCFSGRPDGADADDSGDVGAQWPRHP